MTDVWSLARNAAVTSGVHRVTPGGGETVAGVIVVGDGPGGLSAALFLAGHLGVRGPGDTTISSTTRAGFSAAIRASVR